MTTRSKKRCKKEKTPSETPSQLCTVVDAGMLAGRAVLSTLSAATLTTLLTLKNLPGRSKIKQKARRIAALEGIVTLDDLTKVGIASRDTVTPVVVNPVVQAMDNARRDIKPGSGVRLNVPVAGIDVHAGTLTVAIAGPEGIRHNTEFTNDAKGIESLLRLLDHHGVKHAAMESTAEYWLKACWSLQEHGVQMLVANAQQTKATQGVKTDPKDARRIALAFRDGRLKPSIICTPEQQARRKLNRDAIKKSQQAAKVISRLKAMYHVYDAPEWITELHDSQRGQSILTGCLELHDLAVIEALLTTEFANGKGMVDDPQELREMAIGMLEFLERLGKNPENLFRFGQHLKEFMFFRQMAKQYRLQLLQSVEDDEKFLEDVKFLLSCPSIGEDLALTLMVELVDIHHFWSSKALVKWSGMACRVNQSGFQKRATGHVYKGGNKWIRWAMFNAAKVDHAQHAREGHPVGYFVNRLYKDEKKAYKVAVLAGGRKLLTYVFHVLSLKKPFDELYREVENVRLEANKKRKLQLLNRLVKEANASDLLPAVIASLKNQCKEIALVDKMYVDALSRLLATSQFVEAPA